MISLLAHIKETKHSADGFILPFVLSDLLLLSLKSNLGCMSNAFGLNWGGGIKLISASISLAMKGKVTPHPPTRALCPLPRLLSLCGVCAPGQ